MKKITKHDFFFKLPLYSIVEGESLEGDFFDFFEGSVDACVNGLETTYEIKSKPRFNNSCYDMVRLVCRRKGSELFFVVFSGIDLFIKIGQYPSLADLQYSDIDKKYKNVLSDQDLHDLKKVIGISAHGAGAGSLVYLRRIFENIIWETYRSNKGNLKITEVDFKNKRMDEKVFVLKKFLPSELVEMKKVYGILSKGIHELSEQECLTYFPALKLSIELILDQKIEEKHKKEKSESVKIELDKISESLKQGN